MGGDLDFPGEDHALNRGHRWTVWAVLGAGLLLTGIVWNATRMQAERETAERFAAVANDARDSIESRVRSYSEVLRGVRALYLANEGHFSGQEFTDYVAALDLAQRYPGIQVIHYAQRVQASSRASTAHKVAAWARLPLQVPLIRWALASPVRGAGDQPAHSIPTF